MPSIGSNHREIDRERQLLERCGIDAEDLADEEVRARAARIVRAVEDHQRDRLGGLWEEHKNDEFARRDVAATMATMTEQPYNHNVPSMVGGAGREGVERFYAERMIPSLPADAEIAAISRTVGSDQLVDEFVLSFTHDREIEFMLPGIPATGKRVELAHVAVVHFEGDKIHHEHIWWDQASLLIQVGCWPPTDYP